MAYSTKQEWQLYREANQRAQKTERLSSEEKRSIYYRRGKKCEISNQRIPLHQAEGHHNLPVASGGRKKLSNLTILHSKVHALLHEVADAQFKKEGGDRKRSLADIVRWGDITEDITITALELTRASRIMSGEDPSDVYSEEYKYVPEYKEWIDRLEGVINETMEA